MTNTICPWCGHKFQEMDAPLRSRLNGKSYCDRDCYDLDMKFAAKELAHSAKTTNTEGSC